jgi:glycosyltransferase involved in cell wall biosynthesis
LNILFVSDVSIRNVIGGAERVLYEQSTRLTRRGHEIHVLTRQLPDHPDLKEIIQGVHESRYPVNQGNAISLFCSSTRNCRMLYESVIQNTTFDVLNFHQPFSSFGVLKSRNSRGAKKIYTCHSLSFEEYQSRNPKPRGLIKRVLYALNVQARKIIEGKALRSSDKIIVLSSYSRGKVLSQYGISPDKIILIPGGVDLERFRPAANRMDIRRALCLSEHKIVLLSLRNLVPRMGLENLIQAMPFVVQHIPDIQLIIGGSGPLKEDMVRLAEKLDLQDFVRFDGFIPEIRLPDYYGAADLFVLPTIELEGFGLVTLEALASGLPVIGTPVGGTMEILGQLDSRFLIKGTDRTSIASLIVELCRDFKGDPSLWHRLSSQCRAFSEERYSWERNVEATEKVFLETVHAHERNSHSSLP